MLNLWYNSCADSCIRYLILIIGGSIMNIRINKLSDFVRDHILYRVRLWGGQSKRLNMSGIVNISAVEKPLKMKPNENRT